MMYNERDMRVEQALDIAKKMAVAARTAPKAKGVDILECVVVEGEDVDRIAAEMHVYSEETGVKFPLRDAANIQQGQCVLLIGTRPQAMGLNCGHCGFATCDARSAGVPCAINSVDVGIAIGSACATAADHRVDTRVMFSAGLAAQRLGLMGEDVGQVYAIPVSIASKSPFFDRSFPAAAATAAPASNARG